MKKSRDEIARQIVFWLTLVILVSALITEAVMFARFEANGEVVGGAQDAQIARTRSDYILIFVMGIPSLVALLFPVFMKRKLRVEMPSILQIIFCIFLFAAVILGEIGRCYYTVPHFDDILHACSSAMFGAIGFSIVNFATKRKNVELTPFFMALFAFSFAVMLGALWEIMEFSMDSLAGLNAQKALEADGTPLIGKAALLDTMKDIIVDFLGAFTMSLVGLLSLRGDKIIIEKIMLKKEKTIIDDKIKIENEEETTK